MSCSEEPPPKRHCISYKLCIYCQDENSENLVDVGHANFKIASYENFLSKLHRRVKLGNLTFAPASKRLQNVSSEDLKQNKASWHSKCYKLVTNLNHINRDRENFSQSFAFQDITNLTNRKRGRRSFSEKVDLPSKPEGNKLTLTRSQIKATSFSRTIFLPRRQ